LIVIIGSFFIYYALILAVPKAAFYGAANYIVFLSGLFLVFFDLPALKQAFTPLFFIAAATSSSLIAERLEPFLSPFLNDITHLLVNILRVLGVNASYYPSIGGPTIEFTSLSGNLIRAAFIYECIGIFSVLVFSIIIGIVMLEDTSDRKAKLAAFVVGVLGTFAINIVRIIIIFLTDYFYGAEAGANVHYVIGYILFSAWMAIFLFTFSKRKTIQTKIQTLWQKPSPSTTQPKST
jgi:exosortase/archaeosortase family protein